MLKKIVTTGALTALMAFSASSFAAATPVNVNGQFVGVNGIVVNNVTYNASWTQALTAASPIKFYDKKFARTATQGLFKTLLAHNNDSLWTFDTNGINRIHTPGDEFTKSYLFLETFWLADPDATGVDIDKATTAYITVRNPYTDGVTINVNDEKPYTVGRREYFISWTAISPVPVPSAAFMFAPALLGFAALRRKKRA